VGTCATPEYLREQVNKHGDKYIYPMVVGMISSIIKTVPTDKERIRAITKLLDELNRIEGNENGLTK
jgi:hypothetical protein